MIPYYDLFAQYPKNFRHIYQGTLEDCIETMHKYAKTHRKYIYQIGQPEEPNFQYFNQNAEPITYKQYKVLELFVII